MTGVYADLHFVAEKQENGRYKCIPKYSGGNGTDMTFLAEKVNKRYNPKFYDTLEEALGNKDKHNRRLEGIREERMLTGYYNREY